MSGTHNYWLVLLSIVVAITASFVTLELAARAVDPYRRAVRRAWLAGGALAMGTGIWSMHFIGMLGFTLPIEVSYDVPITLISLAIGIGAAAFALVVATRGTLGRRRLAASGPVMGIAIAGMHYTGMAALRMDPPIRYVPVLFGLSILIAVAASLIALWSAFRLRLETLASALWKKAGSALVMGTAIFGMHYTAMHAARFAPGSVSRAAGPQEIDAVWLGAGLGAFTLVFLMATLLICAFDAYQAFAEQRRLARRLAGLQEDERRALAAELHDIVGQDLSAVNAELALLTGRLPEAATALASAASLVKKSVEAIRHVMARLRPPGLNELGLAAGLRWHAENFQARTAIPVSVTVDEALGTPSPAVEDALLRVYLEALANVEKHAAASRVEVMLRPRHGFVVLTIADDGRGFDTAAPVRRDEKSGWGLMLMRERAAAVGAELRVDAPPGAGTRVEFILPREKWR